MAVGKLNWNSGFFCSPAAGVAGAGLANENMGLGASLALALADVVGSEKAGVVSVDLALSNEKV